MSKFIILTYGLFLTNKSKLIILTYGLCFSFFKEKF
jgi:hypothetical protein